MFAKHRQLIESIKAADPLDRLDWEEMSRDHQLAAHLYSDSRRA
jgi:hypothetical protein